MIDTSDNIILTYKNLGETPLECLERIRVEKGIDPNTPMTYAGRLDPLAEGTLLILVGDECKNKEKYLGLDKEYEVEVLFGITTDTGDALGMITEHSNTEVGPLQIDLQKYVGKFSQPYPAYSSKTANGTQLHELARRNELPDEMPEKEVEIYEIKQIGSVNKINDVQLLERILNNIDLVKGDFRQEEIKKKWGEALSASNQEFSLIKISVKCSSGTYMRSLAESIGKDAGMGAFALSIKRTKIFT
jgi:tRNA pseudouridine(55) synthase